MASQKQDSPKRPPPARARKSTSTPDPKAAKDTEARVQFIMTLMEFGTWNRLRCRQLASTWGVSDRRVRDHSAEAHRRLSEDREPEADKGQTRRDITDRLMAWAVMDAEEGDRRTANKHLELVAKINGLVRSQQQVQFEEEIREMFTVIKQVLPLEVYRNLLRTLVAAGKGDRISESGERLPGDGTDA